MLQTPTRSSRQIARLRLLILAYASFISLGLPDGLIGVAWPAIRVDFNLDLNGLGALFLTTTTGYAVSSIAAGPLTARLGVGGLLALSTAVSTVSLLGYTLAPGWVTMVSLGVLAGAGGGAIDAALNAHAAAHYSARAINLLHAFYGVGTTAGPLIMTAVLLAHLPWQRGYVIVAAAQLALALCFAASRRSWPAASALTEHGAARASLLDTARVRAVRISMFIFFAYVGLESAAGAWIYSVLFENRGLGMGTAGAAVSIYWGGLFTGRLAYALIPVRYAPSAVLSCCMAVSLIAASVVAMQVPVYPTLAAIAALGMASGPVFPLLIATTPERVGALHANNAVGLQVGSAAAGTAILPAGAGLIAGAWGLAAVPIVFVGLWLAVFGAHTCLLRTAGIRQKPAPCS